MSLHVTFIVNTSTQADSNDFARFEFVDDFAEGRHKHRSSMFAGETVRYIVTFHVTSRAGVAVAYGSIALVHTITRIRLLRER